MNLKAILSIAAIGFFAYHHLPAIGHTAPTAAALAAETHTWWFPAEKGGCASGGQSPADAYENMQEYDAKWTKDRNNATLEDKGDMVDLHFDFQGDRWTHHFFRSDAACTAFLKAKADKAETDKKALDPYR
jgi:hypothetical protein